jgi:hypothetical protein
MIRIPGPRFCGQGGRTSDLRNAAVYLIAVMLLIGGLLTGVIALAQRVMESPLPQSVATFLDLGEDGAPTYLHLAIENAREIRAALAKPIQSQQPLPPIAAKLAYGHLRPGNNRKSAVASHKTPTLPRAALEAMASTQRTSFSPPPQIELHRVY